ncbi:hypothetical protein QTP88_027584 [Uroleucon formosanum]
MPIEGPNARRINSQTAKNSDKPARIHSPYMTRRSERVSSGGRVYRCETDAKIVGKYARS